MNRFSVEFLNKIKDYFKLLPFETKGKNLCVCLSGGADSVSLLRAMNLLSDELEVEVSACHFNHMIRGQEADEDELFCKNLCKTLGIKIYCGRDDVPLYAKTEKKSVEEAARECRYSFFQRVSEKQNIDYCLTAHNMNDDAETLLFNLIRGSGSNGASSISLYNGKILRPLLKVSRKDIEDFLSDLSQEYVTDSTNLSVEYTRNYIRSVLIPEIEKINPMASQSLSRYADSVRADREYFDEVVSSNLDVDLRTLPEAIRRRVIIKKFYEFSSSHLNFELINELDNLIFESKRSIISIFSQYEAVIYDGKIEFYNKTDDVGHIFHPVELSFGENSIFNERVDIIIAKTDIDTSQKVNKLSIANKFSFDKIVGDLRVKNRSVGDKICIHGINKSLKKLFIEMKIPKEYRNIIPVVFDDLGIVYVPFVGIADRVFAKDSKDIVYIKTTFNTIEKERWNDAYEK